MSQRNSVLVALLVCVALAGMFFSAAEPAEGQPLNCHGPEITVERTHTATDGALSLGFSIANTTGHLTVTGYRYRYKKSTESNFGAWQSVNTTARFQERNGWPANASVGSLQHFTRYIFIYQTQCSAVGQFAPATGQRRENVVIHGSRDYTLTVQRNGQAVTNVYEDQEFTVTLTMDATSDPFDAIDVPFDLRALATSPQDGQPTITEDDLTVSPSTGGPPPSGDLVASGRTRMTRNTRTASWTVTTNGGDAVHDASSSDDEWPLEHMRLTISMPNTYGMLTCATCSAQLTVTDGVAPNSPSTGRVSMDVDNSLDIYRYGVELRATLNGAVATVQDSDGVSDPVTVLSHQWVRIRGGQTTAISGATSASYIIVLADIGATLCYQATFIDLRGFTETVGDGPGECTPVGPVPNGPRIEPLGAVVGSPVTVNVTNLGYADVDANTVFSYQWYRLPSGTGIETAIAIPDATGQSYTPTSDDLGMALQVEVRYPGKRKFASEATVTVTDNRPNTASTGEVSMTVASNAYDYGVEFRATLNGAIATVEDSDGVPSSITVLSHQWVRIQGGRRTSISGATAASYTIGIADIGATLCYQATFMDLRGFTETVGDGPGECAPVGPVSNGPRIEPLRAVVDSPITVNVTNLGYADVDANTVFSYQWHRLPSGTDIGTQTSAIPNATGQSYTPTTADLGMALQVEVIYSGKSRFANEATIPVSAVVLEIPRNVRVETGAGGGSLTIAWRITNQPRGVAPTGFEYRYRPRVSTGYAGSYAQDWQPVPGRASARSIRIGGRNLINGAEYHVEVRSFTPEFAGNRATTVSGTGIYRHTTGSC